jgi:hypothetical protein
MKRKQMRVLTLRQYCYGGEPPEKAKKKKKKKSDWQFEGNLADGFSVCSLLYVNQHPDIILQ